MKKILMFMPVMKGGGAERVASLLMNEFHRCGYETEFVLTQSRENDVIRCDLNDETPLVCFKRKKNVFFAVLEIVSSLLCKIFEKQGKAVPAVFAYLSFASQYYGEIKQTRQKLKENPGSAAIAFLQPTIPILMVAARGLDNKIIFSERGNPDRLMKHRFGEKFISKYYQRADAAVFQTDDAKNTYPAVIGAKGTVISNPVKSDLPEAYHGERNNYITTFCRVSKQKNLPLLVKAFSMLHEEMPGYKLKIIGDAINEEGEEVFRELEGLIEKLGLKGLIEMKPFSKTVHSEIINDAMYVNSSDYEGISNAMLEAMAIGLPCVCTDCPIGGARATIKDGENGLLVPVGDEKALYEAMKKIASDSELSKKLSLNAEKTRFDLSLEKTAEKWMELI